MSTGTGSVGSRRGCRRAVLAVRSRRCRAAARPAAPTTAGISSGCRAASSSNAPSARQRRLDAADERREARLGLDDVQLGRRFDGALQVERRGARNWSVSASRMRRTSSASCSSSATISLLISTVLSGSRNRLAPLAELPWMMPGIADAVLGLDDEHVAAVAVGDDLVLQVLRGVLAAQERLERAAQPRRAAFAADRGPPAVPGWRGPATSPDGSILSRTSAISLLNDAPPSAMALQDRERGRRRAGWPPRVASTDSRKSASAEQPQRLERPALDGQRRAGWRRGRRAPRSGKRARRLVEPDAFGGGREQLGDPPRVGLRAQRRPGGRRRAASARKPAHGLDDPVEFEGLQGACVHSWSWKRLVERRGKPLDGLRVPSRGNRYTYHAPMARVIDSARARGRVKPGSDRYK